MSNTKSFTRQQIINLLKRSIKKRNLVNISSNALRLLNGAGDDLPGLTIDRYNEHFLVQIFHPVWNKLHELIGSFINAECNPQYIIIKDRTSVGGRSLARPKVKVILDKAGSRTIVSEGGLQFNVDLNDTINPGLFLDMRQNRKIVGEVAASRSVLNCFAYTCAFGVYARYFGAPLVINVDISSKILNKGKDNYALNRLNFSNNEFIRSDTEDYLTRAVKKENKFDLVILDPPSFSRSQGKVFSVKNNLAGLIGGAMKILKPQGLLFVTTNYSSLTTHQLSSMVKATAAKLRNNIEIIKPLTQDIDFFSRVQLKESHLAGVLCQLK